MSNKRFVAGAVVAPLLVCFVLSWSSCSGKRGDDGVVPEDSVQVTGNEEDSLEDIITATPMPEAADEIFDDFMFNFVANGKLQRERIVFPLPVYENGRVKRQIEKKAWKTSHFFMQQDYYTIILNSEAELEQIKDTSVSHAAIEDISLDKQTVRQYVFDREHNDWRLTSIQEFPLGKSPHASFLAFYRHFSQDKDFQTESMASEVTFSCPDPDDDFEQMTGTFLPEQWPAFAPALLPAGHLWNVQYGQAPAESAVKVFVLRGIANGLETQLTFRLTRGRWKLVKLNT